MSTNFNRRRGARANQPRKVRLCMKLIWTDGLLRACSAAVRPDHNGNRCAVHR